MSAECYKLYRDDIIEINLKGSTDNSYIFNFFNRDVYVDRVMLDENREIFLHVITNTNGRATQIFIEPKKRWEFKLIETKGEIMKEKSVFEGQKIKEVVFRAIDPIALESALEKIELGEDVQLKTNGGDTYLVSSGKSLKITGQDFQSYLSKFLIGQYINDIDNPSTKKRRIMKELIIKLGIVKGFVTEDEDEGLEAFIFG